MEAGTHRSAPCSATDRAKPLSRWSAKARTYGACCNPGHREKENRFPRVRKRGIRSQWIELQFCGRAGHRRACRGSHAEARWAMRTTRNRSSSAESRVRSVTKSDAELPARGLCRTMTTTNSHPLAHDWEKQICGAVHLQCAEYS